MSLLARLPKNPQFGENDPSTEIPPKRNLAPLGRATLLTLNQLEGSS
jgi:hypothetical protein